MQLKPSCLLTPRAIEGPYYFDPKLERADLTEGHPGAPLEPAFVVMEAASCQPPGAARADVRPSSRPATRSAACGQARPAGRPPRPPAAIVPGVAPTGQKG